MKAVSGTRMPPRGKQGLAPGEDQWQPPHLYEGRTDGTVVIPIHGSQSLKIGLQRSLMKLAGLREEDL
jgi:hypothetical protein